MTDLRRTRLSEAEWISEEIMSRYNGTISIRSRLGSGTVVVLFLPYRPATTQTEPPLRTNEICV